MDQAIKKTLLICSLLWACCFGCDQSSVTSLARIEIHMLSNTEVPLAQSDRSLPSTGRMSLTPYDVHSQSILANIEYDLSTGTGALPELPIGLWRFLVSGEGGGYRFFGTTGEFEIKENETFFINAIVGQEFCTGLLPPMKLPLDRPFGDQGSSDIPQSSIGSAIAELPNGQVIIAGGGTINADGVLTSISNKIHVYDPQYGLIFPTGVTLNTPRAYHRADQLDDGRILITGGYTSVVMGVAQPTASAELIELDANGQIIVSTNNMLQVNEPRAHHASLKLKDGTVLITGGLGANGAPLNDVTRFYPLDSTFREQGAMAKARAYHAMAPLDRDPEPAIIIGGMTESGPTASIEMFTVRTGSDVSCMRPSTQVGCFINGGSLASERWGHVALSSTVKNETIRNVVIIAGGYSAGTQPDPTELATSIEAFFTEEKTNQDSTVELPDVQAIGVLSVPRANLSGVTLKDDTLLIVGGEDLSGNAVNEVTTLQLRLDGTTLQPSLNRRCPLSEARTEPSIINTRDGGAIIVGGRLKGQTQAESGRVELFYPSPPSPMSILSTEN